MANPNLTKRSRLLPDLTESKKGINSIHQKGLPKSLKLEAATKLDHMTVRGHIVPGCNQIHDKSSDSDKLSEEDRTKKRYSNKLRTMKLQPVTERNMLMEKFESSLKERLLSSASFSKQVPLFDGLSVKDKVIRMKTPSLDEDDLDKNESMFNAVFPARKDNAKCSSPHISEELFSKHNRESQDWLRRIENEARGDEFSGKGMNNQRDEENLRKITSLSKKIKRETSAKESKSTPNELFDGTMEQIKFLSSPRLSSKVGERGSSKSKMAKEKYNSLELNSRGSQKMLLPKLSSKTTSKEASKCVIMENQKAMETDMLKRKKGKGSGDLSCSNIDISDFKHSSEVTPRSKDRVSRDMISSQLMAGQDIDIRSPHYKASNDLASSQLMAGQDMEIRYVETNVSEKQSVEIYGQDNTEDRYRGTSVVPSEDNTLETGVSSGFSSRSLRPGGPLENSAMYFDEYNVLYFETKQDSDPKTEDTAESVAKTEEEPPTPQEQLSNVGLGSLSGITFGEEHSVEHSAPKVEEAEEEEEIPKEIKGEEEDCTAEPCNEPTWFEEYGIDKKSRKDMVEDEKSDDSLEGDVGEPEVEEQVDATQEVVQEDEDVLEAKKKRVKKRKSTDEKEVEEATELLEQPKEFESEVVRQILTVPLVTLDQIPERERSVAERPKSQMPMAYLQKYVAKHLVAGLAQVALYMPSDPVEYLAHWLIKERKKETLLDEFKEFKAEVRNIRKKNIDEMRRKLQMEYLQNEALQRYNEGKYEPLYPSFDSSESETDLRSAEEGTVKHREEESARATSGTSYQDVDDT